MATSVKDLGVRFNSSMTTANALANNTTNAGKGTIHFTTDGDIVLNGTNYTGVKSVVESTSNGKIKVNGTDVDIHGWSGKQDALSFLTTPSSTNKVVTKSDLDAAVAGASNYLGTVTAASGLSTTAKKGDFYRVATAWSGVHVGDILIAEQDNPAAAVITSGTNGYTCLHNEINTDTHDTNVAGTGIAVSGTRGNTIALSSDTQTSLANGATAYGWGNHASAGYLKSSDLATWAKANTKPTYAASEIKLSSNYAKASTGSTSFTAGTTTVESAIASLAKAVDGKYAKPSGGIPATDLESDVQNALAATAALIWD